jgi:hypothetical protein
MKAVKRGCGRFAPPKTAFKAAPFFGSYATTGAPGGASAETGLGTQQNGTGAAGAGAGAGAGTTGVAGDGTTGAGTTGQGTTGGGGGGAGNGNGGFDPDLYETPPQQAPQTDSAAGGAGAPG